MRKLIKYGASAAFVGLTAWLYISLRDFNGAMPQERCRMLSDAFTVPGFLLLMLGCLIRAGNMGALDGITYALRFVVRGREESYGDFVERKRRSGKGCGFLFLSGGVAVAVSVVFLILFYSMY